MRNIILFIWFRVVLFFGWFMDNLKIDWVVFVWFCEFKIIDGVCF